MYIYTYYKINELKHGPAGWEGRGVYIYDM